MKIFVCYARVDKPFCREVVRVIDHHEVFVDDRFYAGDDWWEIILDRLAWCDVLIFLISLNSLKSVYCKRELNIAMQLGKRIVPLLLDDAALKHIPKSLSKFHWVDLTGAMTDEVVQYIHESLLKIETTLKDPTHASLSKKQIDSRPPVFLDGDPVQYIGQASDFMQQGEFDRAQMILQRLRDKPMKPMQKRIVDEMISQNEKLLDEQLSDRTRDMEYRTLCSIAHNPYMREVALEEYRSFCKRFPDYDPQNIYDVLFGRQPLNLPTALKSEQTESAGKHPPLRPRRDPSSLMPMLEFLPVHTSSNMRPFELARYPVTNQQFNLFINDPDGASRLRWWTYSDSARSYRKRSEPLQATPESEDLLPRSACWYDAMAFCFYLSEQLERRVLLPTRAQRRRAAQGTDGRRYPFGNELTPDKANYRESGIGHTTPVNAYNSPGPYGHYDLSGNTWEWLLDGAQLEKPYDHRAHADRYLAGGSFRSRADELLVTSEMVQSPELAAPTIGFRVMILLDA
jgi:hypothetical protein